MKSLWMGIAALAVAPMVSFADIGVISSPNDSFNDSTYAEEGELTPMFHGRRFACFAQNRQGHIFRAIGRNPRRTQRHAMRNCFYYSYECRPLGCRRIRRY